MPGSIKMIVSVLMLLIVQAAFVHGAGSEQSSGWSLEELLEQDNSGSASYPEIGTDANGNAIAVWNQNDGAIAQIVASRYRSGVGWGDAEFLTAGSTSSLSPALAVNSGGIATAVWRYSDGTRYNIVASVFHPGTGWGQTTVIETGDGEAQSPQVDMNDDGLAIAVWSQFDGTRHNIYANVYSPDGGWGTAALIETDNNGEAYAPQVAIDTDGEAVAVWHQQDGTRYNILANKYSPSTGWDDEVLIESDDAGNAYDPRIDMDASGNAFVVWRQYDGSIYNVMACRYISGSIWYSPEKIESGDGQVQPPINVAVDSDGNVLAIWLQWDGTRYDIMSNRFTRGVGWETEVEIDNLDKDAGSPHLDMNGDGNAIAVWKQYVGGHYSIYASRYVEDGGWSEPDLVETRVGSADVPRVSVDPSGDAIAVWYHFDGYRFNIWSNRFTLPDTTPPPLVLGDPEEGMGVDSPTVMVTGTTEAGTRLTVNGLVVDVAWDGSFHVDIALDRGLNTLTVVSMDASGNHAVETRNVTFTDPLSEDISSLTGAVNGMSASLSLIFGNISDLEDEIASIKEMLGSMNTTDNTSSIMDELEILSDELDQAGENLTLLKERLSALEGNQTVDLSGILALVEVLEDDIDGKGSEIAALENDVSSLRSEVDSLDGTESGELKDDVDRLNSLLIAFGAALIVSLLIGLLLIIILFALVLKRKVSSIEE